MSPLREIAAAIEEALAEIAAAIELAPVKDQAARHWAEARACFTRCAMVCKMQENRIRERSMRKEGRP